MNKQNQHYLVLQVILVCLVLSAALVIGLAVWDAAFHAYVLRDSVHRWRVEGPHTTGWAP